MYDMQWSTSIIAISSGDLLGGGGYGGFWICCMYGTLFAGFLVLPETRNPAVCSGIWLALYHHC